MRQAVSQATFADLEFLRQGITLDPVLAQISRFLDDHPDLALLVEKDLTRGLKRAKTGRPGLTAEQTPALLHPVEDQGLAVSGAARTHRRRFHPQALHPLRQPHGAKIPGLPTKLLAPAARDRWQPQRSRRACCRRDEDRGRNETAGGAGGGGS